MDPFPVVCVKYFYPQLGSSLTLKCTRPRSNPRPNMFWAIVGTDSKFYPINMTDRITMDSEGYLFCIDIKLYLLEVYKLELFHCSSLRNLFKALKISILASFV